MVLGLRRLRYVAPVSALLALAVACGGTNGGATSDSGGPGANLDSGADGDAKRRPSSGDGSAVDAPPSSDAPTNPEAAAGGVDSGADTSSSDAHPSAEGAADSGPPGALAPAAPCTGTEASVYASIANLPAMTEALRGDIVACTNDGVVDAADVQTQLNEQGDTNVTAVSGVTIYRVQYRTTRANGSAGYSSARIYLPLVPLSSEPPLIVAAHGTEGLASSCATSMDSTSMRDLALPWATLGYPVIAPDYASLGTAGVQGYTDNRDTARSVVDSVAALRKFVSGTLSQQVVIDGHSQGGGAALATQALAKQMGLQGNLVAVLAFAPEYFSHLDSLGFIGALESAAATNPLTAETGVTKCEVAALIEYAYFANYVPAAGAIAGFPASDGANLGSAITSLCTVELGGAIQGYAPHVADWTDATLRGELLACVTGMSTTGDGGETCTGEGQAFYQYLLQNIIPPDPTGAPVLLVQGLEDFVMPPDEEAACNVIQLKAGGLTPQICTDATASHTTVVQRNIAFGMQWAQAVLAGTSRPVCADTVLPPCDQP